MAETKKKKSFKDYIDNVIGGDGGLKTNITHKLTGETYIYLIGTGLAIIVIAHLVKNAFKNKQIERTNNLLVDVKKGLKV